MASGGRPKTTMAKLQREAALRERRSEKAARKRIRRQAQLDPVRPDEVEHEAPDDDADATTAEPEPAGR